MEEKKNNKLLGAFIIVLIFAIVGILGTVYFYKVGGNNQASNCNNQIETTINSQISSTYDFSTFAKAIKNKDVVKYYGFENYSYIANLYFQNGNVYVTFKEDSDLDKMNALPEDINKLKQLPKQKLKVYNDYEVNVYKLPLENIVLVERVLAGQAGTYTIFMESEEGKVYSFVADQTGASSYNFFNSNGEMNIQEETKLKNIVSFGSYVKDNAISIYGIDISGNVVYK